ncbi:protein lin-9 homolog [Pollicipes pollicipes]|uniref:protein lin-9 homolog n=1 Tax=Pollicipes pollicipes TaxID=41117 RepID=UPI0018851A6D|nr:protein lin-9 homolog [Pollicipes pollicipes]
MLERTAFFAEERGVLQSMRQKVRTMQSQQRRSFDRAFLKNLPDEIPVQLSIGTRVTARLRQPQDGLFTGMIQALDAVNATYRIRFEKAGLEPQSVPDYEVRALDLPELRSPLANDPLMSAGTPAKSELRLLDPQGVVNGYTIKFLVHVVRLNKILAVKREHVGRLEAMNTEAERAQLYGQPLTDEFQRRYAQLVLQLESINTQLRETTTDVQQSCQQRRQPVSDDPAVLELIRRLTSLLLQVKNFADNEMNPFELSSLEETMREIKASLQPDQLTAFQDQVQGA